MYIIRMVFWRFDPLSDYYKLHNYRWARDHSLPDLPKFRSCSTSFTKIDLNHDFNRFFFPFVLVFPGKLGLWEVPATGVFSRIAGAGRWRQPSRGGWREGGGEKQPSWSTKNWGWSSRINLEGVFGIFLPASKASLSYTSCRNLTIFFCHMSLLFMLRLPNKYVPHQMTIVTSFSEVTSWDVSLFSGNFARNVNRSGWLHWRGSPKAATAFAGWDLKPPPKKNYFTSSDPHHDMLGGGCQVRVVIENMMGRMENLRTLISGFLGLVILVR